MKRLLLSLCILLCATPAFAWHSGIMGGGVTAVAATYLVEENFDGANECTETYTSNCNLAADSWVVDAGTPDYDNAAAPSPLEGTYSLRLNGGAGDCNVYTIISGQNEIWVYLIVNADALPSAGNNNYPLKLRDSGGNNQAYIAVTTEGHVLLYNGTSSNQVDCSDIAADTTYHWWVHYTNAGVLELYDNTSDTKPGSADCSISDGSSTGAVAQVFLGGEKSNFVFDKIRAKSSTIGSSPD